MEEFEYETNFKQQWSGICLCGELNLENSSDLWEQSSAVDAIYSTKHPVDRKSRDWLLSPFRSEPAGACSVFVLLSISSHKVAKAVPRIDIEHLNQQNSNCSELPSCYLDTQSVDWYIQIKTQKNKNQQMSFLLKWIEKWMHGHLDQKGATPTRKGYWLLTAPLNVSSVIKNEICSIIELSHLISISLKVKAQKTTHKACLIPNELDA